MHSVVLDSELVHLAAAVGAAVLGGVVDEGIGDERTPSMREYGFWNSQRLQDTAGKWDCP